MEWSTTNNVRNERVSFMPPPRSDSNFSNWLRNFDCNPYAGNSCTQTGPIVSVPELEKITNVYQCQSNNNEMIKKKKKTLTTEQLASLEQSFREDIKLDLDRKLNLSKDLGLQPRQVAVWFQNRRARWKVKNLEESYDLLRQDYEAIWREKEMLHDEVKKLRGIILRNQSFMKTQSNLDHSHQITGIGEYSSSSMIVASSSWPQPM